MVPPDPSGLSPDQVDDTDAVLSRFTAATEQWFRGAFASPTAAQVGAWDAVSTGQHALVVAPTGSGKTLAAFLWALDGFVRDGTETAPTTPRGTRVLYVSPLKALGVDVERNLRSPLIGITQTAKRLGIDAPEVSVGVRSGDTPARERRRLVTSPPDILITTPESLYLMLTSQARSALTGVETVIIDEVHAVAGDKRGAHLALSLERLDELITRSGQTQTNRVQRIGLSATVRPAEEVARFVGGTQPVRVVDPEAAKSWDIHVSVPVEDMTELPSAPGTVGPQFGEAGSGPGLQPHASLWPHVEEKIVDVVAENRSTIVFANSRRLAERLTGRLNEIWEERLTRGPVEPDGTGETADRVEPSDTEFARAHHGSVSKEQRALVEDALKSGRLRCVVATSSLELGIDMGAVDVVVQVEAPPSVASGLQRVGRAGHQVGETSVGWFFPKQRGDLVTTAVVTERMQRGAIESLRVLTNPLDVLAQQSVAAVAIDEWDAEKWFDLVRRAAPFTTLPHSAYESVLDLLAGRYPSDEFAELRPRVVWDREAGSLTSRPGAQRLAVTSGGTIPDRGLFGVFLAGSENESDVGSGGSGGTSGSKRTGGRRVGELDEEMVYESRVGDVVTLGATSWQIQDITHDRVLVIPAFGQPGRLPFWRGDAEGRPVELGRALGAFRREISQGAEDDVHRRLASAGLDDWAMANLRNYLSAQAEATGQLPTERTLVVERFRDELGDWRVVLHSPLGMAVHAPWALAVGARLRARYGMDGQAMAADDGIVLRVPMMDDDPPGAELFTFDTDELDELVRDEVGSSALFAARFRENAARALLLPRRDPGQRTPLWQQRQRSAQLLEVARKHPSFPIILETVRECLQDVYDLPGLTELIGQLDSRAVRLVETTTNTPSPFAQSLLFGYTAQFMYEGDSPLAERRAAALSLDPSLLADLLGTAELRDLLDPEIIDDVEAQLQRLSASHRAHGAEGTADLLRLLGPLSPQQLARRLHGPDSPHADGAERAERAEDTQGAESSARPHATVEQAGTWAEQLVNSRRALTVRVNGVDAFAAIEDASRLRDALGIPLPMGVPTAFVEPVADPLGDLVSRYARTHGPFTAAEAGAVLGLAPAVVHQTLQRLAADQRVSSGAFRPAPRQSEHSEQTGQSSQSGTDQGGPMQQEWCDAEVLRRIRRRSLAALRAEVEPVDHPSYARFITDWHGVTPQAGQAGQPSTQSSRQASVDTLASVLDQLSGYSAPASAWETYILPSRVPGYAPGMLDELLATGEFLWSGTAPAPGNDGWLAFHHAETTDLTVPETAVDDDEFAFELTDTHRGLLHVLEGSGAWFFPALTEQVKKVDRDSQPTDAELVTALWDLVWAGRITNDTFSPLRGMLGSGQSAHKPRPGRNRARAARPSRSQRLSRLRRLDAFPLSSDHTDTDGAESTRTAPVVSTLTPADQGRTVGRWSLLPGASDDATIRAHAQAEYLLERYGVITRGAVQAEQLPGGFGLQYRLLTRMEEAGQVRRGYFIEHLGAAQFSTAATVDRLRTFTGSDLESTRAAAPRTIALAATDPANPYGAALPWPEVPAVVDAATGQLPARQRPGRKAGAVVVMVNGELILYLERGGRTLLQFVADSSEQHQQHQQNTDTSLNSVLTPAAEALAAALRTARVEKMTLEKLNGAPLLGTPLASALLAAGFYSSPSGLRFRS